MKMTKLTDDVHQTLLLLKAKLGLKSISETIEYLLKNYE